MLARGLPTSFSAAATWSEYHESRVSLKLISHSNLRCFYKDEDPKPQRNLRKTATFIDRRMFHVLPRLRKRKKLRRGKTCTEVLRRTAFIDQVEWVSWKIIVQCKNEYQASIFQLQLRFNYTSGKYSILLFLCHDFFLLKIYVNHFLRFLCARERIADFSDEMKVRNRCAMFMHRI